VIQSGNNYQYLQLPAVQSIDCHESFDDTAVEDPLDTSLSTSFLHHSLLENLDDDEVSLQ
jgi:hypothetical protein